MKLMLLNIYSLDTMANYLLSSYVLKSYLTHNYDKGLKVEVLNYSTRMSDEKICNKIINDKADTIGFSCYTWNIEKIIRLVNLIRSMTKDIICIFGGPEITISRISHINNPLNVDYYVIGEGEVKLLHLITYIQKRRKGCVADLPNGVARWDNNNIQYSVNTENIKDLDEIPSIYLNGIIEDRLYAQRQAFIETQRGCRFRCKYCVYHKNMKSMSYYSLNRVCSELDYLIVKKKITALRVLDAIFTNKIDRAKKIARHLSEIKSRKDVKLPWIYWEFTYDSIDEEFIKIVSSLRDRKNIANNEKIVPGDYPQYYSDMLRDYTVINCVGIQSFSNKVLKAVKRHRVLKSKLDCFMNLAGTNNIVLKIDLILGLPYETFDTYFDGLEFFIPYFKSTDHMLNIHRLQILPGSELEALCNDLGINYSKYGPHVVYSTNSMSEEELNCASKLTAVLFRILNSPLRSKFFEAKDRFDKSYYELINYIYTKISSNDVFKSIRLVKERFVDDDYWGESIFKEIKTRPLTQILEEI